VRARLTRRHRRSASAVAIRLPSAVRTVIAPAFVVQVGGRPAGRFGHPTVLEHAVEGPVQRARLQFEPAVGEGGDLLEDGVAMPFLGREGQQDVEFNRAERHQLGVRQLYAWHTEFRREDQQKS
jgi:hypothetical protein